MPHSFLETSENDAAVLTNFTIMIKLSDLNTYHHFLFIELLQKNKVREGDDLTVMVINEGEIDLYLNFACSCRLHDISMSNVIVFAGSRCVLQILLSYYFHPFYLSIPVSVLIRQICFSISLSSSFSLSLSLSLSLPFSLPFSSSFSHVFIYSCIKYHLK